MRFPYVRPHAKWSAPCYGRDASYDGVFFVGVRTTGIFCRPSCPARKPLAAKHRVFRHGRRRRFGGLSPVQALPARWTSRSRRRTGSGACWSAWTATTGARSRDRDLRALGHRPARVRRYFRDRFGMTFHAYCRGRRMAGALRRHSRRRRHRRRRVRSRLRIAQRIPLGLREDLRTSAGSRACDGMHRSDLVDTALGPMIVGATSSSLCLVEFATRRMLATQVDILRRRFGSAIVPGRNDVVARTANRARRVLRGAAPEFRSSARTRREHRSRSRCGRALRAIPYRVRRGRTRRSRAKSGRPGAVRAVGTANGANRIAHRHPVPPGGAKKSGELGGYGGGRWRKLALLDLERRISGSGPL